MATNFTDSDLLNAMIEDAVKYDENGNPYYEYGKNYDLGENDLQMFLEAQRNVVAHSQSQGGGGDPCECDASFIDVTSNEYEEWENIPKSGTT